MKKMLLPVTLLLSGITYAQTGIGIDLPDPSAVLQISSPTNDQGLLIPEIELTSLTDASVIKNSAPAIGLIIYNTRINISEKLSHGFYYWGIDPKDAAKKMWIKIIGSVDVSDYIKGDQSFVKIDPITAVEGANGKGMSIDTKEPGISAFNFNETLTSTIRYNNAGTTENIITAPTAGLTYYEYMDESGAKRYITVSQDVSNDFSKIVANNKNVIIEIIKSEIGEGIVSVTHVETVGGEFVIKVKNNDGAENEIKIPLSKLMATAASDNIDNVKSGFKFNNGITGSADVAVAESLTTLTNNKTTKAATELIAYKYTNESDTAVDFSGSQDVIDDFNTIVENNNVKTILETLIKGNAKNPWFVQGGTNLATLDTENIFHTEKVAIGGNQMIGNSKAANEKLSVHGDVVISGKFYSANSVYADYVFEKYFTGASNLNLTYEFKSLDYVKDFIEKYNHLPGVTRIADLGKTEDGKYIIDFTELSIQQLEKIEELYLYTIEQQQEIDKMKKNMSVMQARLDEIEKKLNN